MSFLICLWVNYFIYVQLDGTNFVPDPVFRDRYAGGRNTVQGLTESLQECRECLLTFGASSFQ